MNGQYINGDAAEFTGKSEMVHGQMCYQYRRVEGHKAGKIAWSYRAPIEITLANYANG